MPNFKLKPRSRTTSELVIHRLYQITSDYDSGFDSQVASLLAMGCERFQLDIGILSRIAGEHYEVVSAMKRTSQFSWEAFEDGIAAVVDREALTAE